MNDNTAVTASVSLSSGDSYEAKFLPKVAFCNISESPSAESVKKNDVMVVPDMTWSSKEERFVEPKARGKLAIVFLCDGVGNNPGSSPASRYYGKLVLTVTP